MNMKKTIYIPIEIKVRELASQVLLASKLAQHGGRVYLGAKSDVFEIIRRKKNKGSYERGSWPR